VKTIFQEENAALGGENPQNSIQKNDMKG